LLLGFIELLLNSLTSLLGKLQLGLCLLDLSAQLHTFLSCTLPPLLEIIVTHFTDASWTPLFALAGGIVTDLDGNENWLESGDILAANPKIMHQMLQVLNQA
jgi:myo-inositol-1(or 4)-monophosphatase